MLDKNIVLLLIIILFLLLSQVPKLPTSKEYFGT